MIRRVFTFRDEDSSQESCEVNSLRVPVCASCADRHRSELKHTGLFERILPALKSEATIAFFFHFLATLFCVSLVLKELARGRLLSAAFMMAPVALFGLIAAILWWQILNRSLQFGAPPDTIVSASFRFSPRKKKWFEPERRRFEFQNEVFFNAFVEANRAMLWDERSPQAIQARNVRTVLQYAALVVFAGLMLWYTIADWIR